MLDSQGHMVMETRAADVGEATIEDRTGRELTHMKKQFFTWDGKTYAWKTTLLRFTSTTTYVLRPRCIRYRDCEAR